MKRIKVLLAALLLINISAFSQNNSELLKAVQEKYNSNISLSADFIFSVTQTSDQGNKKTSKEAKFI